MLIKRCGASQNDIDEIEEEIMQMNPNRKIQGSRRGYGQSTGNQHNRRESKYRQESFKEVSSNDSYDEGNEDDDS